MARTVALRSRPKIAMLVDFKLVCPRFFQLVCLCLVVNWFQTGLGYKDGLYATEDNDVLPLSSESFQKHVMVNEEGIFWAVEFYNSWCGHCIHFAPTWKLLAHTFQDWADLVKVAAIDCSQTKNLEACREFDIERYPTVKFFPPGRKDKKKSVQDITSQELIVIRKHILRAMANFTPSDWPRLTPLNNMEDVWKEKRPDHTHVSLIFEEKASLLGVQVILDMRHTNVLVRHMTKESVEKHGIVKFPSLYKMDPDLGHSLLVEGRGLMENDRKLFVSVLKKLAMDQKINTGASDKKKGLPNLSVIYRNKKYDNTSNSDCSSVSMQDLESALHYTFRQEIAICKLIDGEKFVALQKFAKALLKYFPGRPPVVAFLKRISFLLGSLSDQSLTGEVWMDKIDQLQDERHFLPDVIRWDCCRGSLAKYRGYPCAMWTLFHTLTVASYYQNQGQARPSLAVEVPMAIRGYMEHFFGCEECSKNFLAMSHNIQEDVKNNRDAVLWLWSAHNRANKRLHGDVSEDPMHLKIQFPSKKACPGCRQIVSARKTDNDTWNEDIVLKYLLNYYDDKKIMMSADLRSGPYHGIMTKSGFIPDRVEARNASNLDWWEGKQKQQDLRLVDKLRAKKRESAKQALKELHVDKRDMGESAERRRVSTDRSWGFTHLDLSMCVVFYIISTLIILLLYHHFIIRRSLFNSKGICFRA